MLIFTLPIDTYFAVVVVVMTVSVAVVRPPKYKSPDSTVCGVSPCLGQLPVSGASQANDPWLGHTGT